VWKVKGSDHLYITHFFHGTGDATLPTILVSGLREIGLNIEKNVDCHLYGNLQLDQVPVAPFLCVRKVSFRQKSS
jgi:hypothetical protein